MRVIRAHPDRAAKVLMVTNMWPYDGDPDYGIFVKRQIDSLQALGLEHDVVFIEGFRSKWEYVRVAWLMLRLSYSPTRPLLVHSHGGETAVSVCWYMGGTVLLSYCGSDLLGIPHADGHLRQLSRPRRFFFQQMARVMTATITKSREMEATLPPIAQARNTVLPNGVDRSLFRLVPRDDARRQLGWSTGDRIVLFAPNPAVLRKRYWLAQAACREAEKSIGPIQLITGGDIPPQSMPLHMAAADCLLLTSSIEGSPNVVKEAMACDLPVVSTDVGDVRELLRDVRASWMCAPDPRELGAAVGECLTRGRRSNGREQSEWLDQAQIAVRLLELYRRLVPGLDGELPTTPLGRRAEELVYAAAQVDDAVPAYARNGPVDTVHR